MSQFLLAVVTVLSFCVSPLTAQIVLPGYDLFSTQPTGSFDGISFAGVPLGSYDFGGATGVQNVGDADAIVQRLQTATTTTPSIDFQLDALQMETTTPVSLGGGPVGNYFVTLQSADGTGPASTGQMTLSFGSHPTFTSSLDVFYDIHYASPTGQIVQKGDVWLNSPSSMWGRTASDAAVLINGINHDLNGTDNSADFWTCAFQTQCSSESPFQNINTAVATPEPRSWTMAGICGVVMGLLLFRRRHLSA